MAVFFTDRWANTINNTLNCPPSMSVNFDGCAPPEAAVGWCSGISFMNPITGNGIGCGATQFPSQLTGSTQPITQANIADDAMYRSIQVANAMRAQNIVIYSIGLGDKISQAFLQQVANDPASSTSNPTTSQWGKRCLHRRLPICRAFFRPSPRKFFCVYRDKCPAESLATPDAST